MAKSIYSITLNLLLLALLFAGEASAQWPTTATDNAVAIRCVNTTGTAFESCGGAGGSGGTSSVDKAAFTASSTYGTPAMGAMDDAASSTCAEGEQCITRSTANRALHVNLRDASGNELSVGGGTQYAQGTAATDTDTMNMLGCRRADTAAAATGIAALDRAGCIVDATQRLWTHVGTIDGGTITSITNPVAVTGTFYQATQPVSNAGTFATQAAQSGTWTVQPGNTANTTPWLATISQGGNAATVNGSGQLSITCANCSGSGASAVDDAAFTVATGSGAPAMGLFDDVSPDSVNEGDAGVLRMSANRALYVNIRDNAGNERGLNIAADGSLAVTGTVAVTGVATSANQTTMIGHVDGLETLIGTTNSSLTTIDGRVDGLEGGLGAAADAAATAGSTGSLSAKQRLMTSQLDSIKTAVETIDNMVSGSGVNISQMNGVAVTMGAGATGTGVQRVNPVSSSATGAAPPASASFIAGLGSGATGGFLVGPSVADTFKPVSVTSATTTLLVTGVSGRHVRITSINLLTAIANNVALISGTGATCGTGTAGIAGGTTAANGWNFAANGGLTLGSGVGTVLQTVAAGDSVCVITSAAGPLAGSLGYAIY